MANCFIVRRACHAKRTCGFDQRSVGISYRSVVRSEIGAPRVLKKSRRYRSVRKLLFPFARAPAKCRRKGPSMCKLASLTAEVAPVKSPKDHVATRGPGTPKVHHGTQNAVQVVVHLRNTQASSRKELPAALRRRSGHESSADWLTATEQRDKNVAAAYSCLFSSVPSFYLPSFCSLLFYSVLCSILGSIPLFSPVFSSIRSVRSIGLLFSRPYSLTVTVRAVILFTALLSTRLLRDATVFIFVDRPPCLLQESSSRPQVLLRPASSWRPTYPRARRRLPIFESVRAACRPRRHISSPTLVHPDYSHRVPRGCCDFSSTPAPNPVCVDR